MVRASRTITTAAERFRNALLVFAIAAAACARRMPPRATAIDAERSNVPLAELERGRSLVISKCGSSCHKPPMPTDTPVAEWPKVLDEMAARANLNASERHLIEQYVIAMASP